MHPMHCLAITGTGGYAPSIHELTRELYAYMLTTTKNHIQTKHPNEHVVLFSGGSAWSHHVALDLFLGGWVKGLVLYLPCAFDLKRKRYISSDTGNLMNQCHRLFAEIIGRDTLAEIGLAIHMGARVLVFDGGSKRNMALAQECDSMICFSWSTDAQPNQGASYETWTYAPHDTDKTHYSLCYANKNISDP